jgi:hypothetical protein
MKSHTGSVISFGTGGLLCKSSKQKLNTKSSTEAELVGTSDYLPNALWVKMFLEAQGYKVFQCFLNKTMRVQLSWRKTGGLHVDRSPDTLTFAISLSSTERRMLVLSYGIA